MGFRSDAFTSAFSVWAKADADTRLRELLADLDAEQKKFDDETDHGRKTGVNLDYSPDDDDFPPR